MTDYKIILGILAVVIGFMGYVPYLRDMLKGATKPHVFSWVVWAILEAIAFAAQISSHAGAGAWVTGASMLVAIFVALYAIQYHRSTIRSIDVVAFCGALIGIVLWKLTSNPLAAVILVTASDALAFAPTFRKSYYEPNTETLFEYGMASLKFIVALFALQSFVLTNWLYPASLILTNGAFVVMSLVRRKKLNP